ncbi:MAG TPA: hypothetical protein VFD30_13205 [Terriglobia bacterium]|nr:hypothetical protein [Terriglobia bacterium]
MNPQEIEYRKTGRILTVLLLLYVPVVGIIGFALLKVFNRMWPALLVATLWIVVMIVISILRFVAYYRWTGKYPFHWLR